MALLEARGLKVFYRDILAVKGVSFSIPEGSLISIIGPNGAGKTSIMHALMGIVPSKGNIFFRGEALNPLPSHLRARKGIRLVPERARLFPEMSVSENLISGTIFGGYSKRFVLERMEWIFSLFPILKERRDQMASTLSGGEQQQLAIGRALLPDPKVLLVDEISMGLMPKLVKEVFALLKKLNEEHGLTILLVEQNALLSLEISHYAYVIESGEIVFEGEKKTLLAKDELRQAYLGM
ncbi:MAG TPA: ABC transporter ATP-binding protein [Synergistaceae bacterium]|nr:ABC transporter ATP-binding protein [Synergistaceae bacterium]HPJ24608.1 ABC transporter ATP-binding protein [Synergistaceae bacterium]HPQ36197.1 ABC transporter ATP-binding protein [Synergistaceae bacterium]